MLGSEPSAYAAYATGVRVKYGHLSDDEWSVGRAAVLRRLLAHDQLYVTGPARSWWIAGESEPHRRVGVLDRLVLTGLGWAAQGAASASAAAPGSPPDPYQIGVGGGARCHQCGGCCGNSSKSGDNHGEHTTECTAPE